MRAVCVTLLAAIAIAIAGCGGSDHTRTPARPAAAPQPSPSAVAVIRRWADTLRAGDARAAAGYFGVPSIVANAAPPQAIRSRADALLFNSSLPCGAVLTGTKRSGRYLVATFRLTDRPGGSCGSGIGHPAAVAFVIGGGKILEWRRVAVPEHSPAPPPAPHDDPSRSV